MMYGWGAEAQDEAGWVGLGSVWGLGSGLWGRGVWGVEGGGRGRGLTGGELGGRWLGGC